jgi:alpha-mannosidase
MLDIHVISHTHWDREWYLTYEQFRMRLVALIDRLLDLLEAVPAFKHFHLDGQTIVLEDYLEIRPEQEPRLRRAIESGRILIGPWYVMPDEFLVSGESLIRNLDRGHRISRQFGRPMPVGYLPDLFGHVAQMPQILRQIGLDNTILWRGFGGRLAEYWWQAPDGSRVLLMHLPPEGYCNATRIVFDPDAMMARAAKAVEYERTRTAVGQALLMNGVDHVEPQEQIPDLIAKLSAVPGQLAHHSTLPAYVDAVRRSVERPGPALETITGELRGGEDYANLLPGVLSARVYLKQHNAHVQTLLESYAEPLALCASLLGARYPAGELRHAWKTLMQNHPHDSICGCSIDAVHEENMTRFARARQVADAVVDSALSAIADSVAPANAPSLRLLAVNPDLNVRAQVVEAFVDLPYASAEPRRTVDANVLDRPVTFWPRGSQIARVTAVGGGIVPFQILGEEDVLAHEMSRFDTPWALQTRRVRLLWWAPELPPVGYAAFDLLIEPPAALKGRATETASVASEARHLRAAETPSAPSGAAGAPVPVRSTDRSAQNEFIELGVNGDGTLTVVDRASGTVFRNVALLEDTGDVGDEYTYAPPESDRRLTTADAHLLDITRLDIGPLRATFRIALEFHLPAGATTDRRGRETQTAVVRVTIDASLDAGSRSVALSVTVENTARDHRLRILFPAGAQHVATARADTAFDIVTRAACRDVPTVITNEAPVNSLPMISIVDAGDALAGATVIGTGLMEYEILGSPTRREGGASGASTAPPAIALTLIRAVGDLSRGDLSTRPSGHAGPPVATPGAQCPGRHQFEIAFEPRGAAPAAGALFASARSQTVPPRVVAARKPDGTAPTARSFMNAERSSGDLVLSALKKAEERDCVIIRLFNPGDQDTNATLKPGFAINQAFAVNFLEERQEEVSVEQGAIRVRLGPHQIQTIEITHPMT